MEIQPFKYLARFKKNIFVPDATDDLHAPNYGQVKNYVDQEIAQIPQLGNFFKHHAGVNTGTQVDPAGWLNTLVSVEANQPASATIQDGNIGGARLEIMGSVTSGPSTYNINVVLPDGSTGNAVDVMNNTVKVFLWSEQRTAWLYVGLREF